MSIAKILSFSLLSAALLVAICSTENQPGLQHTSTKGYEAVDFKNVMDRCNSSFSIPMEYVTEFNSTGVLPDEVDKTGMCYIRCFFEKTGLIKDWKLNKVLIQQTMWPATGDSVEVCEQEGKSESNACTRTYAIAKCLMIRAIVDARNKQVV